jgi:hypothetical protein
LKSISNTIQIKRIIKPPYLTRYITLQHGIDTCNKIKPSFLIRLLLARYTMGPTVAGLPVLSTQNCTLIMQIKTMRAEINQIFLAALCSG